MHDFELETIGTAEVHRVVSAGPERELAGTVEYLRTELLKELVPSLSLAAVLVNPANPMTPHRLAVIGKAAQTLGVEVLVE